MKNAAPALFASRWDSVRKSGKGFDFQVPFVGAVRADGLDIPLNVPNQLFAAEIRVAEKPLAKVYRHRHIDFILVFVLRLLRNLNFSANSSAKVKHGQMGVYLLKDKLICPAVEVQQAHAIFQKADICFYFPSQMIYLV